MKLQKCFTKDMRLAQLFQVIRINFKELSKRFILYDTCYTECNQIKYYELPKTDLIMLIFGSMYNSHIFTTIRRYTPNKYVYYSDSIGDYFEVVIDET